MLDVVEDMVFVKNLEGAFLYNNAAHLAFLGKSREAVRVGDDRVAGRTKVKSIVRRLRPEGIAASQLAALDQSVAALLGDR